MIFAFLFSTFKNQIQLKLTSSILYLAEQIKKTTPQKQVTGLRQSSSFLSGTLSKLRQKEYWLWERLDKTRQASLPSWENRINQWQQLQIMRKWKRNFNPLTYEWIASKIITKNSSLCFGKGNIRNKSITLKPSPFKTSSDQWYWMGYYNLDNHREWHEKIQLVNKISLISNIYLGTT